MIWALNFSNTILSRGIKYYSQGKVGKLDFEDRDTCSAEVYGSDVYYVTARILPKNKLQLECTCPYAEDGQHCKHEAALLYKIENEMPSFIHGGASDRAAILKNFEPVKDTKPVEAQPEEYHFTGYPDDVFFPLDSVLSGFRITKSDYERALQLVEDGKVVLRQVSLNYDTESQKDSQGVILQIICSYKMSENESGQCLLRYGKKAVSEFSCHSDQGDFRISYFSYHRGRVVETKNCRESNYNSFYGRNQKTKTMVCVHKVATLIIADRYVRQYNPGDYTDSKGADLIRCIRNDEARPAARRRSIVNAPVIKGDPVDVTIELVQFDSYSLDCEVKIGRSRYYIVRNLRTFTEALDFGKTVKFGKSLEVDFSSVQFTENGDRNVSFLRMIPSFPSWARGLLINTDYIEPFFNYFRTTGIACSFCGHLDFTEGKILFDSEVSDLIVDGRKEGLKVTISFPQAMKGKDAFYTLDYEKKVLVRTPLEDAGPLKDMIVKYNGSTMTADIGMKEIGDFRYRILPVLQSYGNVDTSRMSDFEGSFTDPPQFTFNLDYENKAVILRSSVSYGSDSYPLPSGEKNNPDKKRDPVRENKVKNTIGSWFRMNEDGLWVIDDDDGIFSFLYDGLDALISLGSVNATNAFSSLKMRRKPKVKANVSLNGSLLDIDLDLDGIDVSELFGLLQSYKKRKVYHRLKDGTFMMLDSNELAQLSSLLENLGIGKKELVKEKIRIPAFRALYLNKLMEERDALVFSRSSSFREMIRGMEAFYDSPWRLPKKLSATLRPYQKDGYQWLRTMSNYGFGGILADEMGLGKTVQMLSLFMSLKEGGQKGCSVVVCPASLLYNWQSEIRRFASDLREAVVAGKPSEREGIISKHDSYDVLITSYDLLKRDIHLYKDIVFLSVVIDEAQYIKNHSTEASKAVKLLNSKIRFAMTGTPIENRLSELWSIFDFLMPGFLYAKEAFRSDFEVPVMQDQDGEASRRLRRMTGPFILRRLKTDVLKDLPEKIEEVSISKLTEKQKKLYDANVLKIKAALEKKDIPDFNKSKIEILSELMRLRQICCDPSLVFSDYDGGSAKREMCLDLIESAIDGGNKVLLFSQFTSMLSLIQSDLEERGIRYYIITGATKSSDRLSFVESFNKDDVPVFLVSLKAGGTGLNLTGANIVIHYDPWWNTAVQNQATDRAHRIGQKKVVTVYKLIAEDTIEQKIMLLQKDKSDLADQILSGSIQSLASLSREDLLEILC